MTDISSKSDSDKLAILRIECAKLTAILMAMAHLVPDKDIWDAAEKAAREAIEKMEVGQ